MWTDVNYPRILRLSGLVLVSRYQGAIWCWNYCGRILDYCGHFLAVDRWGWGEEGWPINQIGVKRQGLTCLISISLINTYFYSKNEKKYTIWFSSAFFNHFSVFFNSQMIFFYKWSRKSSDLWEVHVDSFSDIRMLLDNISDLLHDLSVELS